MLEPGCTTATPAFAMAPPLRPPPGSTARRFEGLRYELVDSEWGAVHVDVDVDARRMQVTSASTKQPFTGNVRATIAATLDHGKPALGCELRVKDGAGNSTVLVTPTTRTRLDLHDDSGGRWGLFEADQHGAHFIDAAGRRRISVMFEDTGGSPGTVLAIDGRPTFRIRALAGDGTEVAPTATLMPPGAAPPTPGGGPPTSGYHAALFGETWGWADIDASATRVEVWAGAHTSPADSDLRVVATTAVVGRKPGLHCRVESRTRPTVEFDVSAPSAPATVPLVRNDGSRWGSLETSGGALTLRDPVGRTRVAVTQHSAGPAGGLNFPLMLDGRAVFEVRAQDARGFPAPSRAIRR